MRTVIIIVVGLVLWVARLGIAKRLCGSSTSSMTTATVVFVDVWLVAAANTWIGMSQAGYLFQEELPFFLLIFLLPVAVAIFAKWKFL